MSDSVANLTVKVDTKSVSAAVKALDALAATAAKVEKSVSAIGASAAKQTQSSQSIEKWASKSESAFAKMEKRLEDGAKKYEQITRLVNKHALSEGMRADSMNRVNRAFEQYNRMAGNVNATTLQIDRATRRYNQAIEQTKTGIESVVKLERQKADALRRSASEQESNAKKTAQNVQRQISDNLSLERILQQAQSRVAGISGRAARQLPADTAAGISSQSLQALDKYSSILKKYGVNSLEAAKAKGEFDRATQAASGSIAKLGGLLPRISDNARTISAAFGAANASMGGFSRVVFSTTAALSALSGAFGLREIVQSGLEIDKFTNTLKTVSNGSLDFQRNLNFLMSEADRVGFAVGDVGNSFARLSLAMKGAGFTGDQTREVFSNLTAASRNFGLSSADTMGVVRALEQSMSKGKFMAEEVRLQMGDRLPIAMSALERAVTKVDGKTTDLNKRFEEGSIDVARYATEFVKQIYLLSGGADTLGRTSQSIQAAFGRLTTELTRTNMVFKEAGFDQALISITDQLREFIKSARESGVVEEFAKATLLLANNVDLLIGALSGFALSGAVRILAGFASKWVAIAAAVAAAGAAIAYFFRSPERQFAIFDQDIKSFEQTYARLKTQIEAANNSVASSVNGMTTSAKSDLEQLASTYEKMGFAASVALGKALKANAVEREKEIKKMEEIENSAYDRLTTNFQANFSKQLNSIYASIKDQEALKTFAELNDNFLTAKISLVEYANQLTDLTKGFAGARDPANQLINLLKDPENFGATSILQAIQRFGGLATALATARNEVAAMRSEAAALESGGAIPSPPPSEPIQGPRFNFRAYTDVKAAEDQKRGLKVLQDAYRQVTGETRILTDTTSFLTSVRVRANAGDKDAQRVLKDYNDALAKNDEKMKGYEKTLLKFIHTQEEEIASSSKLTEAYRQSTLAGEQMELEIKARTEAIRMGEGDRKKEEDAYKKILPLMRERFQLDKDSEQVKRNTKVREEEVAYLEKEQSLLGKSVLLREQELAAFKARQEARGAKPETIAEAERLARQTVELRQQNQYLENSYNELANIGTKAFEQVGDAITEAFSKGEMKALSFGSLVRGVMSSIIQSIIRLGIINPILNSLFGGTMRPTLGAGLSVAGMAGAAGGGGSIFDMLGLSSLLPKEGIFGSLGLTGPGGLLSTQIFAPSGMMAIAEPSIATGAAGLMAPSGGLTLGGLLGGAGLGFGAGTFLNSMLGGNQLGGTIGSGLGAGAGALLAGAGLLGPLGPLAAGLIGGLMGGGLGGLIGPKPSSRGFGYALRAQNGRLAPLDYTYFNQQGSAQFQEAEAGIAAINAYLQQRGLTVSGARAVGGNRFGMGNLGYGEAASFNEAVGSLQFAATANQQLNTALSTRTFAGIEKLQQFVEGFISLQDTIKGLTDDPVPAFTQQVNALIDSFAQATAKAREYGIAEDELLAARDRQIAKLEEQRVASIQEIALGLEIRRLTAEGNDQEAERIQLAFNTRREIEQFTASLDALALSSEEKSRLLVALEQTQASERLAIVRRSTQQISEYLDSLRTGETTGETPARRLAAAREIFERQLALAQAGDQRALSQITQASDTLLSLARSAFGITSGFYDIESQVVGGLQSLTAATPSATSLVDISSIPIISQMSGLRQQASIEEAIGYSRSFDERLGALLPVAEAIQQAVTDTRIATETTAAILSNVYGSETGNGSFAMGAAFYRGKIIPYANGGIPDLVNSPTVAPMALFGEAGPEAIMPLRRDSSGRLGVASAGSDQSSVVAELRAVRNEIVALRQTTEDSGTDTSQASLVESLSDLRLQVNGLREELRTSRLRAQ